jgi:hypothetical protein
MGRKGGRRNRRNLARLNARKMEAMRAAGLSTDQLEAHHPHLRRSESSVSVNSVSDWHVIRQAVAKQRSLDNSLGFSRAGSGAMDASTSPPDDTPLPWPLRVAYVCWIKVLRRRRVLDPLFGVRDRVLSHATGVLSPEIACLLGLHSDTSLP